MVDGLAIINKLFDLTDHQQWQLSQIVRQHEEIAKMQNLISRGDLEHIWIRHILHSMLLAKVINLPSFDTLLDIGTGGGFPSLPIGVLWPEASITAIDGRSRKTKWVKHIAAQAKCPNVEVLAMRAEDLDGSFDVITARAVAPLQKLVKWTKPLITKSSRLFFFKGGNYPDEIKYLKTDLVLTPHALNEYIDDSFFQDKYILEFSSPLEETE